MGSDATAPYFMFAAILAPVNIWFQTHGMRDVIRTADFTERLLGAGGVIWFYLYKALLPINLSSIYRQWHIDACKAWWWLSFLAALVVTAVLWRHRESWGRPFLFAWGFFCIALLPVMGFIDVYFMKFSLVADHYEHIAIIAVIALATAGWGTWHRRMRGASYSAACALPIVAAGTLAFLTWQQSGLYRDEITFYEDTLKKNPTSWLAHNNLGHRLYLEGLTQKAIEHYKEALRLKPDYADAHNNLGVAMLETGRPLDAIEQYKQALKLKLDFYDAHNNLGVALTATGRPKEAIEHLKLALQIRPNNADAHYNMGNALAALGRQQQSIEQYERALALNPDCYQAHSNLGAVLDFLGRTQEAIEHYRQALKIKPDNAEVYNNEGLLLEKEGRLTEAIECYEKALRLKPDLDAVYSNLATAYSKIGRHAEAIATAEKALELARSRGQTERIKQIEDGLNTYRAALSEHPKSPTIPQSKP